MKNEKKNTSKIITFKVIISIDKFYVKVMECVVPGPQALRRVEDIMN